MGRPCSSSPLGVFVPLTAILLRISSSFRWRGLALVALAGRRPVRFQAGGSSPRLRADGRRAGLLLTAAIHGVTVAFERAHTREAFARFVPEAVVDEVLKSADGLRLGGVQREGTVMFRDLRGFTVRRDPRRPRSSTPSTAT